MKVVVLVAKDIAILYNLLLLLDYKFIMQMLASNCYLTRNFEHFQDYSAKYYVLSGLFQSIKLSLWESLSGLFLELLPLKDDVFNVDAISW